VGVQHWLQLALTGGIGPILCRRIIDAAGGAGPACAATATLLRSVEGIGTSKAAQIAHALRAASDEAQRELDGARAAGVTVVCPDDQWYPVLLRSIPDPPLVLYVKGDFEPRDLNALAIVGSRKCSLYGREQADRFGGLLAGAGFTVVSGGARGIDSAAHRAALAQTQGRTVAVLGCGVDVTYPPENSSLFAQIADGRGAVVSEYPMGTPPLADNFPRRNRIVSGMSRGVLVVEADERSGALITARQCCDDHGRPVFAVPGRVDNSTSAGPHLLIRDGAVLTRNLEDILDGLGPLPQEALDAMPPPAAGVAAQRPAERREAVASEPPAASAAPPPGLSDRQGAVLLAMGNDPAGVDAIVERMGLPVSVVLQELTFLSLKGRVKRVDGQTYVRR
jgi:DNA processing protein